MDGRMPQLDPKEALVSGNMNFALTLYKQIAKNEVHKNILFSPFLVRLALIALYQGAKGDTANQLNQLTRLHFFKDLTKVPDALKDAMSTVPYGQTVHGYLYLSNLLHAKEGITFEDSFQATAKGTHLELFASSGNLDEDRQQINSRVEERTENLVDELLCNQDLNQLSSITLGSSFVFKGLWAFQFDPRETTLSWFYSHGGTKKMEVPMMRHKGRFRFGVNERPASCRILELPMGEGGLSTIILLPKEMDGLPKLEQRFSADIMRTLQHSFMEAIVTVVIPMISFDIATPLRPYLKHMEAPSVFNPEKADFSGAFGTKGPFISTVKHRAIFKVSEGGKSDPLPSVLPGHHPNLVEEYFVADHPFIFVLKDNKSDLVHMVGRYQFPNEY